MKGIATLKFKRSDIMTQQEIEEIKEQIEENER